MPVNSPILEKLTALVQDPPPEYVFEIGPDTVAMARVVAGAQAVVEQLGPGVIAPTPVKDNVLDPPALDAAIRRLLATAGASRRQRRAALILPDNSARV